MPLNPQTPGLQQRNPGYYQNQLYDYLSGQYQQQPQGGGFGDIRAEEMRKFQQDILPGIQQRTASSGLGGQHSSANVQMPMQAGMDLSTRLAGLRDQFENRQQQRNIERLSGLSNLFGGQQQYELGRARQRQTGTQSLADILSSLDQSGQRGLGNRFNEMKEFYNLTQPKTQDVLHDPTESFAQGASRYMPLLAKLSQDPEVVKLVDEWMKTRNIQQSATNTATQQQPYDAPLQPQQPYQPPISSTQQNLDLLQPQNKFDPVNPFTQAPSS